MTFAPVTSAIGAYLLHLSTTQHLLYTGRPLGISGIVNNAFLGDRAAWRWSFIAGLVGSAAIGGVLMPGLERVTWGVFEYRKPVVMSEARTIVAGLLVGFGSKLGSGCTSGHFLCGLSRLSPRSITASITFFFTATLVSNMFPLSAFPTPLNSTRHTIWPTRDTLPYLLAIPLTFRLLYSLLGQYLTRKSTKLQIRLTSETLLSLLSGLTFGSGLLLSGMLSPLKTLGFMRVPFLSGLSLSPLVSTRTASWADWDPSLGMVVLFGVVPNVSSWVWRVKPRIEEGGAPYLDEVEKMEMNGVNGTRAVVNGNGRIKKEQAKSRGWQVPLGNAAWKIDARLIIGSIIFGVGWGLGGICPGPALVRMGMNGLSRGTMLFGGAMLAGMGLAGVV